MRDIPDSQLKSTNSLSLLHVVFFCCLIVLAVILNSVVNGSFGTIGDDNDDVLRLVQIKDYLAGQSWFDTSQYRMGVGIGTDMHWSRIPDMPIIALTHIFDVFLPQDKALNIAFSLWPPLSSLLLMIGVLLGVRHYGGQKGDIFAFILMAVFIYGFYRYAPGSIDHHNIQMGFMALAIGLVLDPKTRFWSYVFAGIFTALSIAVGAEIYVFSAIICAYVALNWAFRGAVTAQGTIGYGLGLFGGLLTAYIATISPSEYSLVYCDALSLVTLTAGALGGLGLAAVAFFNARISVKNDKMFRLIALGVLGVACATALGLQAPQCLANPLEGLPADVQDLWLGNIAEAKSIFETDTHKSIFIPMAIGAPIICLIILGFEAWNCRKVKDNDARLSATLFQFVLLASALAMTIYQVRYFTFAYVFSLVGLSNWIAKIFNVGKQRSEGSVLYLLCLVASVPLSWVIPGVLMMSPDQVEDKKTADAKAVSCMSDAVAKQFNSLPKGLILANPNMTAPILMNTKQRVLSGNYHRNWEGIVEQINVSISIPEKSDKILSRLGVDYLHYCKTGPETSFYTSHSPEGLLAEIGKGNIPAYLKQISDPLLEEGNVTIFKYSP